MVGGVTNPTYTYDANGNLTGGGGRTVTWTSFNMVASIAATSNTLTFEYDAERARLRQVTPTGTTLYINALGLAVEKLTGTGGAVTWTNYIYAGGGIVAAYYQRSGGGTPSQTRYFHKDHLGSIVVVTDEAGAVSERRSYDAWGNVSPAIASSVNRGFTGHEHLEEVNLIHMNGRLYDPVLARFLSADPFVQDMLNGQAFDRYTYVLNNPLAYTDPSGYFFGKFFKKNPFAAMVVGLAVAWATGGISFLATGIEMTIGGAMTAGAVAGALTGGLKGAVLGGISGAATFAIGGMNLGLGDFNFLGQAALHGVIQGGLAEIQGGAFAPAFLSASFSKIATVGLGQIDLFKGDELGSVVARGIAAAVVGGTASVIGGGKFQNGAATAAFVYLFNQATQQTRRLINPQPGGPNGPIITFINDDPLGASPNQPVTSTTANMIEQAVIDSGVNSVNINSTTGGIHSATSAHYQGRAVDINRIDGMRVSEPGNYPNVEALQNALNLQPNIRENLGPALNTRTLSNGQIIQVPSQARYHRDHIHVSGQR